MLSNRAKRIGLKELEIFDHFIIDEKLPKHVKDTADSKSSDMVSGMSWDNSVPTIGDTSDSEYYNRLTFRQRLIRFLSKEKKVKKPKRVMTTIEFFTSLSKSYKELTQIAEIAEHYEKALIQTKTMGQVALYDKLVDLASLVRSEAQLIAMGLNKYVTEKQIIDFYDKVGEDKNLKLTWILNFNRIIPEDVFLTKKDVDERKIFDNYVILHYDPENNGEELTKKQIEDKKDPILFGVIKNSKKLYYVADWKDDYCDLTLEDMFNVLGEKVLEINNKNVKTFIDKTVVD